MNQVYKIIVIFSLSVTAFLVHLVVVASLGNLDSSEAWLRIILTSLASATVISTLTSLLSKALSRTPWIFKLLMRDSYMRGTWIGTIQSTSGWKTVFVEHYDQTLEDFTIRGWGFKTRTQPFDASWVTPCVSVDPKLGRVFCLFEAHIRGDGNMHNDVRYGTGRFIFTSRSRSGSPIKMEGISVDEYKTDHIKYEIVEHIDDRLLDIDEARSIAISRYGEPFYNPHSSSEFDQVRWNMEELS